MLVKIILLKDYITVFVSKQYLFPKGEQDGAWAWDKPMTGRQGGGRGSWKGGVLTVRVWLLCDFMMKQVMSSVGLLKVSIPGRGLSSHSILHKAGIILSTPKITQQLKLTGPFTQLPFTLFRMYCVMFFKSQSCDPNSQVSMARLNNRSCNRSQHNMFYVAIQDLVQRLFSYLIIKASFLLLNAGINCSH